MKQKVREGSLTRVTLEIAAQVRAGPRRHEGDPAPEDAARRDLRGAHAGHEDGAEGGRRWPAGRRQRVAHRGARRDLPGLRQAHPRRVPTWMEQQGIGYGRPRPGPQRRARQPRRLRRRTWTSVLQILDSPGGGHQDAGARHGRGLRRAHRARGPAARADRATRTACSRPPPTATPSWPTRSACCPPSSTSRAPPSSA